MVAALSWTTSAVSIAAEDIDSSVAIANVDALADALQSGVDGSNRIAELEQQLENARAILDGQRNLYIPLTEDDVTMKYSGNPNKNKFDEDQVGIYNLIGDSDEGFTITPYQDGSIKFIFKGDHSVRRLNAFSITSMTNTAGHVHHAPPKVTAYYNTPDKNWFN